MLKHNEQRNSSNCTDKRRRDTSEYDKKIWWVEKNKSIDKMCAKIEVLPNFIVINLTEWSESGREVCFPYIQLK